MTLQFLFNAFCLGSFYALVALGFSLILGVTHTFNLAHGEMVILGGYVAYFLARGLNLPLAAILPGSMLAMLLLSLFLERLLQLIPNADELNTLVVTFGFAMLLQNCMLIGFTADYRLFGPGTNILDMAPSGPIITDTQILLITVSLSATGITYTILRRTFLGKALRATIQDSEAARLAGINVRTMHIAAFGLGGLLIGIAGPLYARTAYLHPFGGIEATLVAVVLSIFAGAGRIRGLLVGGWILGLVESATVLLLGSGWREMASAVALIALLRLRPEGLLPAWTKGAR